MPKNYLSEMTPDQVGELLKKQTSQSVRAAERRLFNNGTPASVITTLRCLESEIHRILDGEMIYPLT